MNVSTISPVDAKQSIDSGDCVLLVDVRTPAEHRSVHAIGAKNIPLDALDPECCAGLFAEAATGKIYLVCKSGARARLAAERLAAAGHANVFVVEGGTDGWVKCGLPVERGKAAMSIENQVRVTAGSLVAAGVLLSFLLHPWFVFLSLFVGCGLVFAGITDTCMMGLLLSRMPWNKA